MNNKKNNNSNLKKQISLYVNDIPDNPGFFIIALIGFFSFFGKESTSTSFVYSELFQAVMFGIGLWGMVSSVMMDLSSSSRDDYWINFWLGCHAIKFVLLIFISWDLLSIYGLFRMSPYIGLIIVDLIIIKKHLYENNIRVEKNKKIISKIKTRNI